MAKTLPVLDWMQAHGLGLVDLIRMTGLDKKRVEAIAHGRWTPTAEERRLVAQALGVDPEAVFWGHTHQVEHVYGHGPQFGRSP